MLQHIIVGITQHLYIMMLITVGPYLFRSRKPPGPMNTTLHMLIGVTIYRLVVTVYGMCNVSEISKHSPYCLRWFKGEHTHGTIMPSLSTLQDANSASHGFAFTVPQRSYVKAQEHKSMRRSYEQLKTIWMMDM